MSQPLAVFVKVNKEDFFNDGAIHHYLKCHQFLSHHC